MFSLFKKKPQKRLSKDLLISVISDYITPPGESVSMAKVSPVDAAQGAIEILECLGVLEPLEFEKSA